MLDRIGSYDESLGRGPETGLARMHRKIICVVFTILINSFISRLVFADAFVGHDLYSLKNPGGGFTQVFPTGFRPAADGVVGGQGAHGDNFSHAFLWTSSANPVDLNPAGFTNSYVYAANAARQVGYAANDRTGFGHGFLWSGTAASGVDLTPAGYSLSVAYAASDTRQVGNVSGAPNNFVDHAAIWLGTAASFVDINPAGFTKSQAINLDDTHEIGSGSGATTGNAEHALLWTDGGSVVDLHPDGFATSQGTAVRDGREVGFGNVGAGGDPQALLWIGSSPLAVNLTPVGFGGSIARDVTADSVVGFTTSVGAGTHAAYWTDSAASFVDLHTLLGPGFVDSQAYSIGVDGTIYGTARDLSNVYHAVSWTPLPDSTRADYNGNGIVDAADYVVWRRTLGSTTDLRANGDNTGASGGTIDQADYAFWRSHFSMPAGSGVGTLSATSVPEPAALVLILAAATCLLGGRRVRAV
jgi:hypothetical protein